MDGWYEAKSLRIREGNRALRLIRGHESKRVILEIVGQTFYKIHTRTTQKRMV